MSTATYSSVQYVVCVIYRPLRSCTVPSVLTGLDVVTRISRERSALSATATLAARDMLLAPKEM